MTDRENVATPVASVEEMQQGWQDLKSRVGQLEAEKLALEQDIKTLRSLVERVIEHRQHSHTELVLLLTNLVSKLPLNDVGVIVSRLVEHNTNVSQTLAALIKGTVEAALPQPTVLKTLDHAKRDLLAAIKPAVEELIQMETPLETEMLQGLLTQPELFFAQRTVRANRCFMKGQVPRERVIREFGEAALGGFQDLTTDPKLNPHPKAEEIVLGFKEDFETWFAQNPGLLPANRQDLLTLYQKVQRGKAPTEQARAQKNAFFKLSFLLELLHFYEHQNIIAPDVVFAQRLPALVEQLAVTGAQDVLDEKLIAQAEALMVFVINPDHRHVIANNVGKGGGTARTLKYVLKLRMEKVPDLEQVITEFVKHLLPSPSQPAPRPEALAPVLRLITPEMQRLVLKALMASDRIRKTDSDALGKATAAVLGLAGFIEELKVQQTLTPEAERELAWNKIREMITQRNDPSLIAGAIRDRLNAKYDADEIRQSWIVLIESDPMSFIKVFCQIPYRADGRTDAIARPVMETYVSRLMHEKYAATYKKVANSLKNMFAAKPDSPPLLNFLALVRWVDPESANRLCQDIGMPVPA